MGEQRHEGEQTQDHRRRAGNGAVGLPPLGLDAEAGTRLAEGHVQLPAQGEPRHDLQRIGDEVIALHD